MKMDFKEKIALITGGSAGLGRYYAKFLADQGAFVIVNGRSNRCHQVVAEIIENGGKASAVIGTVSDPEQCKDIITKAISLGGTGRLDILINNAGNYPDPKINLDNIDNEDLDTIMRVHVNGSFNLSLLALRHMFKQNYGRILNVSSGTAMGGIHPSNIVYGVAKAAIIGLTKNLAKECKKTNIRINAIMPFAIPPNSIVRDTTLKAKPHCITPEQVCPVVAWLVHEDVPCNGEVFFASNGKIARVFWGQTSGLRDSNLTAAKIGENFSTIMDTEQHHVPGRFMETIDPDIAELLNWDSDAD